MYWMAKLQHSNLDPNVVSMLLARLEQSDQDAIELKQLSKRTQHDAAYIKAADLKIAALTLELAHDKRIASPTKAKPSRLSNASYFKKPGMPI